MKVFEKLLFENDDDYNEVFLSKIIVVFPVGIYLLKVNTRNTRTRCEICSKLTIKTPERRTAERRTTPERRPGGRETDFEN